MYSLHKNERQSTRNDGKSVDATAFAEKPTFTPKTQEASTKRHAYSKVAHPEGLLGYSPTVEDINPALRTLNYGKYGIFLIKGNAGFISSKVVQDLVL